VSIKKRRPYFSLSRLRYIYESRSNKECNSSKLFCILMSPDSQVFFNTNNLKIDAWFDRCLNQSLAEFVPTFCRKEYIEYDQHVLCRFQTWSAAGRITTLWASSIKKVSIMGKLVKVFFFKIITCKNIVSKDMIQHFDLGTIRRLERNHPTLRKWFQWSEDLMVPAWFPRFRLPGSDTNFPARSRSG